MKNLNVGSIVPENTFLNRCNKYTGKASIDKPWLKYFSDEQINTEIPQMTIFDYLTKTSKEHIEQYALDYFGRKITYEDMLKSIDQTAAALEEIGVKKDDIVTVCMPTTPETVYLFYAINKIGAVSHMIDPRTNSERIQNQINLVNSKLVFAIDLAYPKIENLTKFSDVNKIVYISASDSLPLGTTFLYNLKQQLSGMKKKTKGDIPIEINEKFIKWSDFFKLGKKKESSKVEYEENKVATMVLTGGTTGLPKAVMISNDNLNSVVGQYQTSKMFEVKNGDKFLDIMPPFIAYGLTVGLHLPLSSGACNVLIPQFDASKFADLILKHKPQYFMGVPTHCEILIKSKKLKDSDLSFAKIIAVGGDHMNNELENKMNVFLKAHNSELEVIKGYGMTELTSSTCTTMDGVNKIGSVGVPLIKNTIGIFDPETHEELSYNEKGEICITGPSIMLGYYGNEEATNYTIQKDKNGTNWVNTRDIGYIDEDGFLFFADRMKRVIIRPDGHNVFPSELEGIILSHKDVRECSVVGKDSDYHTQGKYPKAYIVLEESHEKSEYEIIEDLQVLSNASLPERDVPYYYEIISELPQTPIGKIDFKSLEDMKPLNEIADTNALTREKVINKSKIMTKNV